MDKISQSTIDLAKAVSNMPEDLRSIDEWAKALSRDLCSQPKFNYAETLKYAKEMGLVTDFQL